jgi:nitrate/nitrite-specific signal transduction histidine kinase
MRTMATRADRLGGVLEVAPRAGGGTRIALSFPA